MARTTTIRALRSAVAGISLALALLVALPEPASAIVPPMSQPTWAELSAQQREILMPLSGEWDQLESFRRKKWLGIAQRYPTMTPDEQQRVQRRMKDWVKLTPAERQQARERYKSLQKAPPEQREAVKQKWQTYKELPDTEKERLRQKAQQAVRKAPTPAKGGGKPVTTPAGNAPVTTVTPPLPQPASPSPAPAAPVVVPAPPAQAPANDAAPTLPPKP